MLWYMMQFQAYNIIQQREGKSLKMTLRESLPVWFHPCVSFHMIHVLIVHCRAMELLSSSQTCKLTHWSRPGGRTCSSTSPTTRSVALATRRATVLQQGISMWVFLFHPSAAIPHFFCIAHKFEWNVGTICLILDWRLILSLTVHPAITVTSFKGILIYIPAFTSFTVSLPSQNLNVLQKISEELRSQNFCCCKTWVIWESDNGWIANDKFWVERWIV